MGRLARQPGELQVEAAEVLLCACAVKADGSRSDTKITKTTKNTKKRFWFFFVNFVIFGGLCAEALFRHQSSFLRAK